MYITKISSYQALCNSTASVMSLKRSSIWFHTHIKAYHNFVFLKFRDYFTISDKKETLLCR